MQETTNRRLPDNVKKPWFTWVFFAVLFTGFAVMSYVAFFTNAFARSQGVETFPVSQSAARFDPFAELAEVRRRVGVGAHLRSIEAKFVRSDGTMDLSATYSPAPKAIYQFVMPPLKAPATAPPIGAGRKPGDDWIQEVEVECYRPGQMRFVSRSSGGSTTKFQYRNEGMDISRDSPRMGRIEPEIGDPKVTCPTLWQMAIAKGAPTDAVATIGFDSSGYHLYIAGVKAHVSLDASGHEIVIPTVVPRVLHPLPTTKKS